MKKRLHYAMSRVPLKKLKGDTKPSGTEGNEMSHVDVIAKIIMNARIERQQVNEQEDDQTDAQEAQNMKEDTGKLNKIQKYFKTLKNRKGELKRNPDVKIKGKSVMQEGRRTFMGKAQRKKGNQLKGVNVDLKTKDMQQMQQIQARLRRKYKRKSLRVVLIDTDSSEERGQSSDSDSHSSFECHSTEDDKMAAPTRKHNMSAKDIDITGAGGPTEVAVDVHHGPESSGDDEQLEGAVGGFVEKVAEGGHVNEVAEVFFAEEGFNIVSSDSSLDAFGSQKSTVIKGKSRMKKHLENIEMRKVAQGKSSKADTFDKRGVQWGLKESSDSDSDGGWDFETGGMPLLPR